MSFWGGFVEKCVHTLSDERLSILLENACTGELQARNDIIVNYLSLIKELVAVYEFTGIDNDELMSTGVLALIKAIDEYIKSPKDNFNMYIRNCINREILSFAINEKRKTCMVSLSDFTGGDSNFDEILNLHDDFDIEDSYILKELCMKVKDFVEQLPDKEKIIVKLYYGFGIERPLFEKEIADLFSTTCPRISEILLSAVKKIKLQLEGKDIIALERIKRYKLDRFIDLRKHNMKVAMSFYDHFKGYSHEEVNKMLLLLKKDQLETLYARYGGNLNSGRLVQITYDDIIKAANVISKIKKMLVAHNSIEHKSIDYLQVAYHYDDSNLIFDEFVFNQIFDKLPYQDAVIAFLRFGGFDGLCLSNEIIAKFLGLELSIVLESIKKALFIYEQSINRYNVPKVNNMR